MYHAHEEYINTRTNNITLLCTVKHNFCRNCCLYKNKLDWKAKGLYTNARRDVLSHIVIKHRHIPITIALLAQLWPGIPCVICLNTTQFAVKKTGDNTQLEQLYDTFASIIEYEKLEMMHKEAAI